MAARYNQHDLEGLIRSAAMAPLPPETVRTALEEREALLRDRVELEALMARLLPAWGEGRTVLNELSKRLAVR